MATVEIDRPVHDPDIESSLITARVWREEEPPRVIALADACLTEGVLHLDVVSGADPHIVYEALRPLCGRELTLPMVQDLVHPDEMPRIKPQDVDGVRAVSAFAVEAVSGKLVFNLVELLANSRWLVTCSHRAESYAGSGSASSHPSTRACAALLHDVAGRWSEGGFRSAGDLGVLVLDQLACSYRAAVHELVNHLDAWERAFYMKPGQDQEPLRELRGLASEFRARLNGVNVPRDEAAGAWFHGVSNGAIAERADKQIDRALAGLDRLSDTLRGAFALLQANAAQAQQQQAERLQRSVELLTAVFLVPTLIAGAWGENTWVPGQGKPWGFAATIAVMVLSSLLVRQWLIRRRRTMEAGG